MPAQKPSPAKTSTVDITGARFHPQRPQPAAKTCCLEEQLWQKRGMAGVSIRVHGHYGKNSDPPDE